jgi:hypothetical protein
MKKAGQRNLAPGDVLEIVTDKGLAYAQCSQLHPMFGPLLRVLPGFHQVRPTDFSTVVNQRELYHVFILWDSSVDPAIVAIVCRQEVPEQSKTFPLFRDGIADPTTGRVPVWWLWDGERSWPVGELTADQRRLSIRTMWDEVTLASRIARGWTPLDDT